MIKDPDRDWDIVNYKYAMEQFTDRIADRVRNNYQSPTNQGNFRKKVHKRDPCWRFNRSGKCKFGNSCTFDHRCIGCGALDHGQCDCKQRKDKPTTSPSAAKPPSVSKSANSIGSSSKVAKTN